METFLVCLFAYTVEISDTRDNKQTTTPQIMSQQTSRGHARLNLRNLQKNFL